MAYATPPDTLTESASLTTARVFEATLLTHLSALEPKSVIMVDFFFFSQIARVIDRLFSSTSDAFFANPAIQAAALGFYNEDRSLNHYHFWKVLSLTIANHFFPPDRRVPPREPSREAAIDRTKKLLLCLLMHPHLPEPQQLMASDDDPRKQLEEYRHFMRTYWEPFKNNNPHLVQRTHDLILGTLFRDRAAPPRMGPRGCVEVIEDKEIDRLIGLSVAPFSESLIHALASLAIFTVPPAGDKVSPNPLQQLEIALGASFRNGFPNDTIHGIMMRATAWRFGIDSYEMREKLARLLCFSVLNNLSEGNSPFLENIQHTIQDLLHRHHRSDESLLVIHGKSSLQHLFKAYRARLKEHLFPRYRRIAIGSGVVLGVVATAYTTMTGIFASTGQTVSMVNRLTLHAANYDLIICSALLSATAAAAYAGRNAVGSIDQTLTVRQMEATLGTPTSYWLRFRNSPLAFSANTVVTTVTLGLSSQDLFFQLMGGDVDNNLELYSPLAIFLVACLSLILLGPWAMQLIFNAYTCPELPQEDLSGPSSQLLPPVPPGMTYGNPTTVLRMMELAHQHEIEAVLDDKPQVDEAASPRTFETQSRRMRTFSIETVIDMDQKQ